MGIKNTKSSFNSNFSQKFSLSPKGSGRHNTYKIAVAQTALAGVLCAVTIVIALLSSIVVMPIIPAINGRVDVWYGVMIVSLVLIKHWQFKMAYLIALMFLLAPIEFGGGAYAGWGDYAIEMMAPMVILMLLAIPMPRQYNTAWRIGQIIVVILLYAAARILLSSLAGVLFYNVDWKAALVYNFPNVLVDTAFMPLAIPLIFVKMKRFAPYI